MVSQAVLYVGHILPVGLIWLACVTNFIPFNRICSNCDCLRHIVFYAPIYAVLLLGMSMIQIYAVSSVVYGVATFNDCPSAKDELVKEIKEAQEDLRKRKII